MANEQVNAADNYKGVWGNRIGFGRKAALLSIDFTKAYTTEGAPLYAPGVPDAVRQAQSVLQVARDQGELIIHTNIRYHPGNFLDGGIWVKKAPVMKDMVDGNPLAAFCDEVLPLDSELVISKQYASAFFATNLAATLTAQGVDTIVLMGCSTSGCIRATAVDGVQYGFRVMVLRDCVGDRHPDPHEANLFDIDSKYGDVISSAAYLDYVQG
ncbi:N-carbamoylsarcosine amidohydrolase [Marinobacter sp. X15-166B]|uniref:N-carbamoylsarcosine amidohydrolase n=1 Tax=Marinobacter sp. X15-166B TaxID=1897620 RepID=UPI00085C8FE2|nr:N-carbamoylsarcosine amidohydrolase [Marinobacter sp. X15-166B]OEY65944.1 isochorismatase [Marinobacter sp. X15-166B]